MPDESLTSENPFESPLDGGLAQRREERKDLTSENPFESPLERSALPLAEVVGRGFKIAISEILFCTFAVALSLMTQFQPWGGFEESQPIYPLTSILTGLSASVFYAANRRRRAFGLPFSSFQPGHSIALIGFGYLATSVFQYSVSFLDIRHVGAPIHILSQLSPLIICAGICVFVLIKTRYAPRWQAFFVVLAAYAVIYGAATALDLAGSPSELNDPIHIVAEWFFHFVSAAWYLGIVFATVAYALDLFGDEGRDWLHHAGVLLEILGCIALLFEERLLSQLLWTFYYQFAA